MVFFICDGCGDTLKKNQVDSHANRCRQCYSVSCMDCFVKFFGDDYRTHTSCITEAERYEKSDFKAKKNGGANKKVSAQEAWTDLIAESVDAAPTPQMRGYLSNMAGLDNVPRKQKQFCNFLANSLNLNSRNKNQTQEIWDFLQKRRQEQKEAKDSANASLAKECTVDTKIKTVPQQTIDEKDCDISDQRLVQEQGVDENNDSKMANEKLPLTNARCVKKAMKAVLRAAAGRTMSKSRLRKAVRKHMALPGSARKHLKQLVQENLLAATTGTTDSKKKGKKKYTFSFEGKTVRLIAA